MSLKSLNPPAQIGTPYARVLAQHIQTLPKRGVNREALGPPIRMYLYLYRRVCPTVLAAVVIPHRMRGPQLCFFEYSFGPNTRCINMRSEEEYSLTIMLPYRSSSVRVRSYCMSRRLLWLFGDCSYPARIQPVHRRGDSGSIADHG